MRIAVVFDTPYPDWTSEDYWQQTEIETADDHEAEAHVEYQVAKALVDRGHTVTLLGAYKHPDEILDHLRQDRPDVVFNLAEGMAAQDRFDFILPAVLEMEGLPYTGAGPQALMVTRNKAMTKKILGHHGISVPRFIVVRIGEALPRAKGDLFFPAIVKPLRLDASEGISQASVVYDREQLESRVEFIHDKTRDAAIVEEYIDGRELYVTIVGNGRQARALPPVELVFSKELTRPEQRTATKNTKWDDEYCLSRGITLENARRMSQVAEANLKRTCKTAFRALWLRDYARLDIRLDAEGRAWVLEANANPYLGDNHEAASCAERAGIEYTAFIEKIAKLAARRHRRERKRTGRRAS